MLYASTGVGSGANTSHAFRPFLLWLFPDFPITSLEDINFTIRKAAHFVQFMVYAGLLWRALKLPPALTNHTRVAMAWVLGSSSVLAFMSEGIQLFYPQRTPQLGDVWIDLGGAIAGAGLAFAMGGLMGRRDFSKTLPAAAGESSRGKILITSDFHLDTAMDRGCGIFERVKSEFLRANADVLLVAGDFGSADRANEWMAALRSAAGDEATVVICLGNQDHWLQSEGHGCLTPEDVREKFWRPACAAHRIQCLDFDNVHLPEIVLCGGYGHYDFRFTDPEVEAGLKRPTFTDYQTGRFAGLEYPDMDRIPGLASADEAVVQTKAISRRLLAACDEGKPVLFATHTIPFAALKPQDAPRGSPQRFFDAFTGNSAIGSLLSAMASSVVLAVSGHTHRPTALQRIHGIPCLTIGSSPDRLRFLLFDLHSLSISPFEKAEKIQ
jgi:VanZ family protein/predicted phosphodiesterase